MAELTKEAIYRALDELGWQKTISARGLIEALRRVGCTCQDCDDREIGPRLLEILSAMREDQDRLSAKGYRFTITGLPGDTSIILGALDPWVSSAIVDAMMRLVLGLAAFCSFGLEYIIDFNPFIGKRIVYAGIVGILVFSSITQLLFCLFSLVDHCKSRGRPAALLRMICYALASILCASLGYVTMFLFIDKTT